MRCGYAKSPSPRWHRKHRVSNSSGVKGLSVANSGEMCIWVMGVSLSRCAFAKWKGYVSGHHFTRYGVARRGLAL